jgi:hypothetical protein
MLPPSVSNRALDELVAYRRIKDRASNICNECLEKRKRELKRCGSCGELYDEEHGRIASEEEAAIEMARLKEQLSR